MALNLEAFGKDVETLVIDAGKSFYTDAQDKWDVDKAFFEEIAADYKECVQLLLQGKLTSDAALVEEMEGNLRQLTGTVRSRVAQRRLELSADVEAQLSDVLWGIGKAIGALVGGAILGAL